MNKGRVEEFSDGVFSIIITIMVLEIPIPKTGDWNQLISASFLNTFIAYLISFVLVGSFWISHHQILEELKTVRVGFMWLNVAALFPISLVPFATAWQGEFSTPAPHFLYGAVYSATLFALWMLSRNVNRQIGTENKAFVRRHGVNTMRLYLVYASLVMTVLSLWIPYASSFGVIAITIAWRFIAAHQNKHKV
ncbi:MAG: TMEM175 family protein [Lactobacillaceae bacterium]|jgi:uncharacterized membrane protein|nr:TMEM175 family protein [Lactobacillaceae bacterium]